MKRERELFPKVIFDNNLRKAILTVAKSHRWIKYPSKPNKTALWLELTIDERVCELRNLIENGFIASPTKKKKRYDRNAGKWREIAEPRIWPDQCVHHAMIQVLEPVMMRGMDHWCCGSIKKRGAHYGIKAIKKWMKKKKGTAWCVEMDIYHFYDSLEPVQVVNRMKELIKDRKMLDLIWRVIKDGIQIGAFCSQWFANVFLQPLDRTIRKIGAKHYIRYMDNFTVFTNRKRTADKIIKVTEEWLNIHNLKLKDNWQKFRIEKRMPKSDSHRKRMRRRLPNALGYRYGRGFTLMRKKNLNRLIQQLQKFYYLRESGKFIPVKFAQGLLSRLAMLRHCSCTRIYERVYKPKTQKRLKNIIRDYYSKEVTKWNTYLELCV